jgi:PTH1 family peptidyl-tRNA hydrolase
MKLLVGLGNVGAQYARSRHNFGFMVVDNIANDLSVTWKPESKLQAMVAKGEGLILAKPQTMMNLSGEAVQRLMQHYKLAPENVWALYDDVDVPFGRLRLRKGGSAGGHQGAASIIRSVGSDFVRVRLGISLNDRSLEPSETYVLKPFTSEEQSQLPEILRQAAAVVQEQLQASSPEDATFNLQTS